MLPGATILLYTDGLIEHRGASIDDGIAVVSAKASRRTRSAGGAARRRVLEHAAAGARAGRRHRDAGRAVHGHHGDPADAPAESGSTSVVGAG